MKGNYLKFKIKKIKMLNRNSFHRSIIRILRFLCVFLFENSFITQRESELTRTQFVTYFYTINLGETQFKMKII